MTKRSSVLYGIAYTKYAMNALKAMPKYDRDRMKEKIRLLASEPKPIGSRQLSNTSNLNRPVRRMRCGPYRALYVIENNPPSVIVLDIGHRKDIYRRTN